MCDAPSWWKYSGRIRNRDLVRENASLELGFEASKDLDHFQCALCSLFVNPNASYQAFLPPYLCFTVIDSDPLKP